MDTGYLKASWHGAFPDADSFEVTTNVAYAPVIEDGVKTSFDPAGVVNRYGVEQGRIDPALPRGMGHKHIKSTVGGNQSVKLTLGAAQRIVDYCTAEVANGR